MDGQTPGRRSYFRRAPAALLSAMRIPPSRGLVRRGGRREWLDRAAREAVTCAWTDPEIHDWLDWLQPHVGAGQTPRGARLDILRELLYHANEDGMSETDRRICARAIYLLHHPLGN